RLVGVRRARADGSRGRRRGTDARAASAREGADAMTLDTRTDALTAAEIVELSLRHTLFDWTAQENARPIAVDHAKGVEFFTVDGKRYLDFNSQLWSVNIGQRD